MERFDADELELWAQSVQPWRCVTFMLLCAERMLPQYRLFMRETGWGDDKPLRTSLDAAWKWASTNEVPEDLTHLADTCEQSAPDTEDFDSEFTSAALDAAASITTALDAIREFKTSYVVDVAMLGRDSVDLWLQRRFDTDPSLQLSRDAVVEDPLMQRELRAQREQREYLRYSTATRRKITTELRARCSNLSMGSLECEVP